MRLDNMTQLDVAKAFLALSYYDACQHCLVYKHYDDAEHCPHDDCGKTLYKFLTEDEDMATVRSLANEIGINKLYALVCELRGE